MATLIVLSGPPASGKSTLARRLAQESGAVWLRIDSMDQAIRESGVVPGDLKDVSYRAAYAVARDNLRLGRDVVADSVNDMKLTRDAWRAAGLAAGARVLEVEVLCSDPAEHRWRVENRTSEVPGLVLPDWAAVTAAAPHPWDRDHLTVDTAGRGLEDCVQLIRDARDGVSD
ncbi:AAA family ATPase [Phenylobacterium sp.]|uniref:AAA family ATPase n=1 Tax=Phenylobacterium sp. TaxID=1871053 RepID=UPI003BAC62CE